MPSIVIVYIVCAVLATLCRTFWLHNWELFAVLKPLTTIMVIVWAYQRIGSPFTTSKINNNHQVSTTTRDWAILLGLVMSLVGDIALLWPKEGFLAGLIAFLFAHIAFLIVFTRGVRLGAWTVAHVAYAALGGAMLAFLWDGISQSLRIPVILYICCLVTMAAQTASWWKKAPEHERFAKWAALGGLLFVVSDSFLAIDKFYAPLPMRALLVQSTYWAALGFLVYSLTPKSESRNSAIAQ